MQTVLSVLTIVLFLMWKVCVGLKKGLTMEERLFFFNVRQMKTEMAINVAFVTTIDQIVSLHEEGLLTDMEYLIVCDRIGW